mmetsp:Transcript_62251/g.148563  ORF Transcript_62251/g.148563 Transcript_62251/m.148563 type:complete len:381 (+) Transcript_62251:317-1459(+)
MLLGLMAKVGLKGAGFEITGPGAAALAPTAAAFDTTAGARSLKGAVAVGPAAACVVPVASDIRAFFAAASAVKLPALPNGLFTPPCGTSPGCKAVAAAGLGPEAAATATLGVAVLGLAAKFSGVFTCPGFAAARPGLGVGASARAPMAPAGGAVAEAPAEPAVESGVPQAPSFSHFLMYASSSVRAASPVVVEVNMDCTYLRRVGLSFSIIVFVAGKFICHLVAKSWSSLCMSPGVEAVTVEGCVAASETADEALGATGRLLLLAAVACFTCARSAALLEAVAAAVAAGLAPTAPPRGRSFPAGSVTPGGRAIGIVTPGMPIDPGSLAAAVPAMSLDCGKLTSGTSDSSSGSSAPASLRCASKSWMSNLSFSSSKAPILI